MTVRELIAALQALPAHVQDWPAVVVHEELGSVVDVGRLDIQDYTDMRGISAQQVVIDFTPNYPELPDAEQTLSHAKEGAA
jgi:hypothetical protein